MRFTKTKMGFFHSYMLTFRFNLLSVTSAFDITTDETIPSYPEICFATTNPCPDRTGFTFI